MDTVQNGKGSKARPLSVGHEEFAANWDAIFSKRPSQLQGPGQVLASGPTDGWVIPDIREILGEEKWREAKEERIL